MPVPPVPSLVDLEDLAVHGSQVPVRATLRLHDDPGSLAFTAESGERRRLVRLPAGDYRLLRDDDRCTLTTADGEPLVAQKSSATTTLHCAVPDLLKPVVRHGVLSPRYTAGTVSACVRNRRPAWLLDRGTTRITVDAETGVLLAFSSQGRSGELVDVDYPGSIHVEEFTWSTGSPMEEAWDVQVARRIFHEELDALEVPEPAQPPSQHRVLPVHVPTWMVQDTGRPQPALNDTVGLLLAFTEDGDGDHHGAPVVTVDAWAEEADDAAGTFWRLDRGEEMRWRTILRGDGWTARWDADRPVFGQVRVSGSMHHDPCLIDHPAIPPTRGSTTRIRMSSEGRKVDVEEVRLPFPSIGVANDRHFTVHAVVLTLDLDRAEPPEPWASEPGWVNGFAVSGVDRRTLWRADSFLPQLWRTDLRSGVTKTVTLPLKVSEAQQQRVRIIGPDDQGGVELCVGQRAFEVTAGAAVTEAHPPEVMAEVDESVPAPESWGGGWVVSHYTETAQWLEKSPRGLLGYPMSRGVLRLGRVSEQGELSWGREEEVSGSSRRAALLSAGDCVMMWREGVLRGLDPQLRVVREESLPGGVGDGRRLVTTSGDVLVVHADEVQSGDVQGWRLSLLDPETLEVIFSEPCGPDTQVQVDDRDTVWLADGGLRCFTRDVEGEWRSRVYDSL